MLKKKIRNITTKTLKKKKVMLNQIEKKHKWKFTFLIFTSSPSCTEIFCPN